MDSWLYYSSYVDDNFYILSSQLFFQTTHDHYLISKIKLLLSPTLYKFIVWVCFRVQAKTGPYNYYAFYLNFHIKYRHFLFPKKNIHFFISKKILFVFHLIFYIKYMFFFIGNKYYYGFYLIFYVKYKLFFSFSFL